MNFEANHYTDMINFKKYELTIPLVLIRYTAYNIPNSPNNKQAFDRMGRVVSEVSSAVCEEKCEGYIANKLRNRTFRKKFNTKKNYPKKNNFQQPFTFLIRSLMIYKICR